MIYLMIVGGIFALDSGVKAYMDSHHLQGVNDEYFGGKLILRNCHNPHGALGIFKKNPQLGTGLSMAVLICTCWEFLKSFFKKGSNLMKLALAMVLGGGCSNFYDRIVKGYVTDYFSFGVKNKKVRNTVFNLSDLFIFLGSFFYVISQVISVCKKK